MQIDWTQISNPIHIKCKNLSDYVEISHILKQHNVRRYAYGWIYQNLLHYNGMSADNARRYGDRVTREAGHFKGWKNRLQETTSGRDLYLKAIEYYPLIHKDDLELKVWDFTNYNWSVKDKPFIDLEVAEDELMMSHKKIYGEIPLWNQRDMQYAQQRRVVTDQTFDNFFFTVK